MYTFSFTKKSKIELDKINIEDKERILSKLRQLKSVPNIYSFIKSIYNLEPSTHRIRIWNYRLLICIENSDIIILKIGHRREIYK